MTVRGDETNSGDGVCFRPYNEADNLACTKIFDANCPEYFALNEREDYEVFLKSAPEGYQVCEVEGRVLGAFGLLDEGQDEKRLNWILLDPQSQGMGIGEKIMERVIRVGRESQAVTVNIAASHKSEPFFAKFGARTTLFTKDGWGPGMDRVDMVLSV